ncbi:Cell wall-associated hydrolase, NlpC family [Flexibacter flexilis DSM 6793]|uniref:Cell wall-associated hydrolase, NlpC family n=1 Tax=Flexibacter flexilis DSM 6793 TaxID=927664 RepID=A0A1I1LL78_9BACT|nr:C40 family peptidase [Flexibacter flexilis]SFC73799.1 Cell wall-associated hydrolase, NlpC family [Flexibacter flexilis DSM 6793]
MKMTLLLLLLLPVLAVGQSFEKLEKLYTQQRYEKLICKSQKAARKYPRAAVPHFYKAKAYFAIAQSPDRDLRQQYPDAANECMKALFVVQTKDQTHTLLGSADTVFMVAVSRFLQENVSKSMAANNLPEAKRYAQMAIRLFADTTPQYAILYPSVPKTAITQSLSAAKDSSVISPNLPLWVVPTQQPNRQDVVQVAKKLVGARYHWTGETPKTGFDCSGLLLYVMRNFGYDFIHGTKEMAQLGKEVPLQEAQKGDWVFFGERGADNTYHIRHVGMIISDKGQTPEVIHSVTRGVATNRLDAGYWSRQVLFVRSVLD